MMMNFEGIKEFHTTWNNEFFYKNKATFLTAKRLIKKSIVIVQIRLCRELKYTKNDLLVQLKTIENEREILKSSLTKNLQQRLKDFENQINNSNKQINNLIKQEKDYWKQLEKTIAKRTNLHKITTNKLSTSNIILNNRSNRPINTTYVTYVDKNNENLPPSECIAQEKIAKTRKKKKFIS